MRLVAAAHIFGKESGRPLGGPLVYVVARGGHAGGGFANGLNGYPLAIVVARPSCPVRAVLAEVRPLTIAVTDSDICHAWGRGLQCFWGTIALACIGGRGGLVFALFIAGFCGG